jgi:hypothetical protein
LNHHASPDFWRSYRSLPASVRRIADRNFDILKGDSRHPSLHLKKVGRFWSSASERDTARSASSPRME